MSRLHLPIRILLYRDEGRWFADCLEFAILGDGETQREAFESMATAIEIQAEASEDFDNPSNMFNGADSRRFEAFAMSEDIDEFWAKTALERFKPTEFLVIEGVLIRGPSGST